MKRLVLILTTSAVLACSDPAAIRVPVEFDVARGREPPSVDTVLSVGFEGVQHVVIEGMIWRYCEDFSADATQWTDGNRSVVTLYVLSEPPASDFCVSQTQIHRYTALIEVQHQPATGPTAWEARVYHRGKRVPVPPWGHM